MDDYASTTKKKPYKPKTPTKPRNITDTQWNGIDLRNQGIINLSLPLFSFTFIYDLLLENNNISNIPQAISNLKNLEILNLSNNKIKSLPTDIAKLVNLRELVLSNNYISTIPVEFGALYNLEVLDLDNNPLIEPFSSIYKNHGGAGVIQYCKEHNSNYPAPKERNWIDLEVEEKKAANDAISFTVGSFNLLSEQHATESFFGYVPLWALNWETRKELIMDEIIRHNLDILCAQEAVTQSFVSFFRDNLNQRLNYDSLFYPKSKAKTMSVNSNMVDGCATFWKKTKYTLIEHKCIEFTKLILADKRFNENVDIINRNMNKDNIALITVLKAKEYLLIVVNVHILWDESFKDVKLMQCIILIEEINKIKIKHPTGGLILGGDLNSLYSSGVYELLTKNRIEPHHQDFGLYNYHPFSSYGFSHNINLKDSYKCEKKKCFEDNDLIFSSESEKDILRHTNFTSTFQGVIDYLLYGEKIQCLNVLSDYEDEYYNKVVGFPTIHCGSDHILIAGRYCFKSKKIKK